MVCWLFYGFVVTNAYRSKLVGLLTFPVFTEPPKSFQEMAYGAENEYHLTLQYLHGPAYNLLKASENTLHQTIFQKLELEEDPVKCFQRAIGTTHRVCSYWNLMADYLFNKNLSDTSGYVPLVQAPDKQFYVYGGIMYRKRSVFGVVFDEILGAANAMGLFQKCQYLDNDFVRNEGRVWEKNTNISKPIYPE